MVNLQKKRLALKQFSNPSCLNTIPAVSSKMLVTFYPVFWNKSMKNLKKCMFLSITKRQLNLT